MRSSLIILLALIQTFQAAAGSSAASARCRCLSGESCWPSEAEFAQLGHEISQPLVYPVPPAKPCYSTPARFNSSESEHDETAASGYTGGDSDWLAWGLQQAHAVLAIVLNGTSISSSSGSSPCAEVSAQWADGNWRANQVAAMQGPNFETFTFPNGTIDACYLNNTLGEPCAQGSVSAVAVDARSVGDVQSAVRFAAKHNLRFVVKNTGHDYLGRSAGRGSFLVWTHNMKDITVHPSFTPTGAPADESYASAMTLGAGVQWDEAYTAANASGRVLVGGVSAGGTVGAAGGWLLGGGHSALSPSFGLGVDNVLEMSIVTSNGSHLVTNAHQHSDLFWALRGGGGGTFGVVTSVTYQTRPSFPVLSAYLSASINSSRTNPALSKAITELVRITPQLTDEGWGGYPMLNPLAAPGSLNFSLLMMVPLPTSTSPESTARANATMGRYLQYVQELAANSTESGDPITVHAVSTTPFASWSDWYATFFTEGSQVGFNVEMGSWLVPRDVVERDHEHVAETLLSIEHLCYWLPIAGGAVSKVDPSATGLHPAWRTAAAHAVCGITWPEGASPDELNALRDSLKSGTAKLRALAPESGAYFNEASMSEPDPAQAFFGSHYEKLRAVKAVYDPADLFVVAEGVGSDGWDKSLKCRK